MNNLTQISNDTPLENFPAKYNADMAALVNAINELGNRITALNDIVGTLQNLLISKVNETKTYVDNNFQPKTNNNQ